jgi:hypothetical protein
MNIVPGQAPFIPQINVPQYLQQNFPLFVTNAISIIQDKARLNILRMFLFNQCAVNNFANREFVSLIEYAVRIVDVLLTDGTCRDLGTAVNTGLETAIEHSAAYNTVTYQGLASMLDQNTQAAVMASLNNFQVMNNRLRGMQAPVQQSFNPQGMMPQQPFNQQPMMPMQNHQRWPQQAPVGHHQPSGVFSSQGNHAPIQQMPNTSGSFNRFNRNTKPNTEPSHVANIHAVKPLPTPVAVVNNNKNKTIKWMPSEKYPVTIAFDHNKQSVAYVQEQDTNFIKPVIVNKEIDPMNQEDHFIQPSFASTAPIGVTTKDTNLRTYQVEAALKESLTEDSSLRLNIEEDNTRIFADYGLEQSAFECDIRLRMMNKVSGKANVFRNGGAIITPFVSNKDISSLVEQLSLSTTFSKAQNVLKIIESEILDGTCERADNVSLSFINRRLTYFVNDYLKKRLSLANGWIDSFIEDVGDMLEYIETKYGTAILKTLLAAQEEIISDAMRMVSSDLKDSLDSNYVPSKLDPENRPMFFYFQETYVMTGIDLFAHELRFDVPDKTISCGVFKNSTPLLWDIIENIYLHAETYKLEGDRKFIKTSDNVILEVTKGALNPEYYLVYIYKE